MTRFIGLLWSLVFSQTFVSKSKFLAKTVDNCTCLGDILTYNCTVSGSAGGFTVWGGTAFRDCLANTENEIVLRHNSFISNGTFGMCNNGDIVARSLGVEGSKYYSQLNVTVTTDVVGKSVMCINDDTSREIQFSETINTTDTFPPPSNVLTSAVNFNTRALSFSWSPVALTNDCPSLHYNIILSTNCGSCPTTTTDDTVTCTDVPNNSTICTFAVQSVVCGNITSDLSDSFNITVTTSTESDETASKMQDNSKSLSFLIVGAVMLCVGILIPIFVCLLYKHIKKVIINPSCGRRQLKNNTNSCISKEEMGLNSHYYSDEASSEKTLDIRNSGIYGHLDNEGPLTLDNLMNKLHGHLPRAQWFRFGQAIGVPMEVLNSLERCSEKDRLIEMLDY